MKCEHEPVQEVYSQGEKLADLGLDVPEITAVFIELKNAGFDLGNTEYTVVGAKESIIKFLSEGGLL